MDWLDKFRFNVRQRHWMDCKINFDVPMPTINYQVRQLDALVIDDREQKIYLYDNIYFETPKIKVYGTQVVLFNPDWNAYMDREIHPAFETMLDIKRRLMQDHPLRNEDIICYYCLSNLTFADLQIERFDSNDLRWLNENHMWYLFD